MSFNLKRTRSSLRIRDMFPDIKNSDLDVVNEEEAINLFKKIGIFKIAHGHGSLGTWTEVSPNVDPYNTSYYVKGAPWFGGGTSDTERKQFPDGTDNNTNKEKNSDEMTRGQGDDFFPSWRKNKINESIMQDSPVDEYEYLVSFTTRYWDDTDKIRNNMSQFGKEVKSDPKSIYVVTNGYEQAIGIQRAMPGTIITRRKRK